MVAGVRPFKNDVNGFVASQAVLGAAPTCSPTTTSFLQTGSLTVTGVGGTGYSGTLTITDDMGKTSTGT